MAKNLLVVFTQIDRLCHTIICVQQHFSTEIDYTFFLKLLSMANSTPPWQPWRQRANPTCKQISQGLQGPPGLRRTRPPPCLHPHSDERKHAWNTWPGHNLLLTLHLNTSRKVINHKAKRLCQNHNISRTMKGVQLVSISSKVLARTNKIGKLNAPANHSRTFPQSESARTYTHHPPLCKTANLWGPGPVNFCQKNENTAARNWRCRRTSCNRPS